MNKIRCEKERVGGIYRVSLNALSNAPSEFKLASQSNSKASNVLTYFLIFRL